MKKIKNAIVAIAMLVLCFTLSTCEFKYYSATMMTTINEPNKALISFSSFKGTYVMQLKNKSKDEAWINYEATLEEGNIKVYYNFNDEKLDLFEIKSDGFVEGKSDTFISNKTIHIIIESDGKSKEGSLSFVLEKSDK